MINRRSSFLLISTLLISGCANTGGEGPAGLDLLNRTNAVVEGAKALCRFAPTVASIAAILGVPNAPSVTALSTAICNEITKLPNLEAQYEARTVTVTVNDSEVEGVLY